MWTSYRRLLTPPLCAVHSKQTKFPCCTHRDCPPVPAILYVCLPILHRPRIASAQVFRTAPCGVRHCCCLCLRLDREGKQGGKEDVTTCRVSVSLQNRGSQLSSGLRPFHTLPNVVTSSHKLFSLFIHNCILLLL